MVARSVRVPEELWAQVEARAASEDRSAGWVVRKALEQMLAPPSPATESAYQMYVAERRAVTAPKSERKRSIPSDLAPDEEPFVHVCKFVAISPGSPIKMCECGNREVNGRVVPKS